MKERTTFHRRALEKDFVFSQAIKVGDLLFVSGCVSMDLDGNAIGKNDWETQVTTVYTEIRETLEEYGMTMDHIVKETVFCLDMEGMTGASEARAKFFNAETAPTATWVEISRLVNPDCLLEVEVIAHA